MKISSNIAISSHILLLFVISLAVSSSIPLTKFLQRLKNNASPSHTIFHGGIYTKENSSFLDTLLFYEQNLRFNFSSSSTLKPLAVITAADASDVQVTVLCCKAAETLLKIQSGGHILLGFHITTRKSSSTNYKIS